MRFFTDTQRRWEHAPFSLHLETSAGSAGELETQLLLAGRLGYLKQGTAEGVLALHAEVERMLDALIRSLKAKISAEH